MQDITDELDKSILSDFKKLDLEPPFIFQLDYLEDTHNYDDPDQWDEFNFLFEAYRYSYNQYLVRQFRDYTCSRWPSCCVNEDVDYSTKTGENDSCHNETKDFSICDLLDSEGVDNFINKLNENPKERDDYIFQTIQLNIQETIINNEIRKLYPLDEPLELKNYILLLKYEIFITKLIEIYETEYANNDDIHYFTIYNEIKALLDAIQEPDEKTSGLFAIINNYLLSLEISESKRDEFQVDLKIGSRFILDEIEKAKKNENFEEKKTNREQIDCIINQIAEFRARESISLTKSYIQYYEDFTTEKKTGISLSQKAVEIYRNKIYTYIEEHESQDFDSTNSMTTPIDYNYNGIK